MYSLREEAALTTSGIPVDLIALDDLKTALKVTNTTNDTFLSADITRASSFIATRINRAFGIADVVETFAFAYGESRISLPLYRYPIAQVNSISVDGNVVSEDDYDIAKDTGLVYARSRYWSGRVIADYRGGYDLPDAAPAALAKAIIILVKESFAALGKDPTLRSAQHGDESVSYWVGADRNDALPAGVLSLIESFKRITA